MTPLAGQRDRNWKQKDQDRETMSGKSDGALHNTIKIFQAIGIIALAAFSSDIFQLSLTPVYGHIPSFKLYKTLLAMIPGSPIWNLIPYLSKSRIWAKLLPVLALSVPTLQSLSFRFSGHLGPLVGPIITDMVTSYPLVFVSAQIACRILAPLRLTGYYGGKRQQFSLMTGRGVYAIRVSAAIIIYNSGILTTPVISRWIGKSLFLSRLGLSYLTGILYALLFPSKYLLLALIPILHSFRFNVHLPLTHNTELLNATLGYRGYSIIARQDSITGYISVLDNFREEFRVMRCDHSLLGGEWKSKPPSSKLNEPIYAIFVMLEAVRLVQTFPQASKEISQSPKNALVM